MRGRARLVPAALLLLTACGDGPPSGDGSPPGAEIQIDTLPNGVIHVSNPSQGLWAPGEEWRLVEELRIGTVEGGGPEAFQFVADLEVDPLGRIWVADISASEVRVFDPDGAHVRTIGRAGDGPGEFRDPSRVLAGTADTMWVIDGRLARHTAFDTAGVVLEMRRWERGGSVSGPLGGFDEEGRLLEAFLEIGDEGPWQRLVRTHRDQAVVDTVLLRFQEAEQVELGGVQGPLPFGRGRVSAVGPGHRIWTAFTDAFRLTQVTPEGDTLRVVEKEWIPEPVTSETRAELSAQMSELPDPMRATLLAALPERKSAFPAIRVDDRGGLWIPPHGEWFYSPWSRFHVIDPEGRYLGVVDADPPVAGGAPMLFRGDDLYTTIRDDLDVVYVVRFRIERVPE